MTEAAARAFNDRASSEVAWRADTAPPGLSNQILDRSINIIRWKLPWNRTEVTIGDSTIEGRVASAFVSEAARRLPALECAWWRD